MIYPINIHGESCFQYAPAVALNHKEIRKLEKTQEDGLANVLYIDSRNFFTDIENIYPAYVSNHTSEC